MGNATVKINGHLLSIQNRTDCYYDISDYIKVTAEGNGAVEIETTGGLISVTNLKATGNVEFILVGGCDIEVPEGESVTE